MNIVLNGYTIESPSGKIKVTGGNFLDGKDLNNHFANQEKTYTVNIGGLYLSEGGYVFKTRGNHKRRIECTSPKGRKHLAKDGLILDGKRYFNCNFPVHISLAFKLGDFYYLVFKSYEFPEIDKKGNYSLIILQVNSNCSIVSYHVNQYAKRTSVDFEADEMDKGLVARLMLLGIPV